MSQTVDTSLTGDSASGFPTVWADFLSAVFTNHSGATRPSYLLTYGTWYDTANSGYYMYDGSSDIRLPLLSTAQTFSGAQRNASSALTSTTNHVAVNFALNNDFTHTLTEDTTLDNPTNIVAGQKGRIFFSGSNTVAYGSYWKFAGGTAPVMETNSILYYDVVSTTFIAANLVKGFA